MYKYLLLLLLFIPSIALPDEITVKIIEKCKGNDAHLVNRYVLSMKELNREYQEIQTISSEEDIFIVKNLEHGGIYCFTVVGKLIDNRSSPKSNELCFWTTKVNNFRLELK